MSLLLFLGFNSCTQGNILSRPLFDFNSQERCVRHWKLFAVNMTLAGWSALLGNLNNVYASESPIFTYHDGSIVSSRFPEFIAKVTTNNAMPAANILQPTNQGIQYLVMENIFAKKAIILI